MAASSRDIGSYIGAELIARGGFSAVYRAVDPRHGRDVAIKVIQGAMGDAERRRFDRECQAMGRLGGHPNIVAVHDSGYTPEGEAYLVMELAAGGTLSDRLARSGPLPWTEVLALGVAVAGALQVAHDEGILHRDVKPENIMIDRFGTPKLSDFGIAVMTGNVTATANTAATLAHAAPELLEGRQPTTAVDIYALGSTLHALLSGLPPFQRAGEDSVGPLVTRTLTEPPPDLRPLGVPDPLASVIERALAKDPTHRPPTAAALAAELDAAGRAAGAVAAPTRWLVDTDSGAAAAGAGSGLGSGSGFGDTPHGAVGGFTPSTPTRPNNRTTALVVGGAVVVALVVAGLVITAISAGGTGTGSTTTTTVATTTTRAATTTTVRPTTTATTVATAPPAPSVQIDCPATIPVLVRTECSIVSANAEQGTYEIPGFTNAPIAMQRVPGANGIFVEPLATGDVGRSFTITAVVVAADGRQASAQHTFVLTN